MKRSIVVLVLFLMARSVRTCASQAVEPTRAAQEQPDISAVVPVSGEVVSVRWAALSFSCSGLLTKLQVQERQGVQAGQELAVLDSAELELAVGAASEALAAQQAQLAQALLLPLRGKGVFAF